MKSMVDLSIFVENGQLEFVDLPVNSMVMFQNFLSLPEDSCWSVIDHAVDPRKKFGTTRSRDVIHQYLPVGEKKVFRRTILDVLD